MISFSEFDKLNDFSISPFNELEQNIKDIENTMVHGNGYFKTYGTLFYKENPEDEQFTTHTFRYDGAMLSSIV
ncbi:MAG: hypothetical protein FWF57_07070 [Defluviitaleaceae bacterium]|nr:hypothetical protein [Defluviitaleaceae bacterium]